ncbi:MAG: DUF4387 family protein [Pseudomonadota bacterium]
MAALSEVTEKIRSKNAGPFWLTIDIFCGSAERYDHVVQNLPNTVVAQALGVSLEDVKRFEVADLNVLKFSMPRPTIQGSRLDRDMHGAQWAVLIQELEIASEAG